MAKLTRKEKKQIRSEVRKWAAHLLSVTPLPTDTLWTVTAKNPEALAYLQEFKQSIIVDLQAMAIDSEADTTES